MEKLKLRYQLREDEINEIFLCLNHRREGIFRDIHVGILSVLGIGVFVWYILHRQEIFWFVLLTGILFVQMFLLYYPARSRKRRVRQLAKQKGEYRLEITEKEIRYGEKGEKICLSEEKGDFFVSENMYVWKLGREVFGIPRRILTEDQGRELERMVCGHRTRRVDIKTKKE